MADMHGCNDHCRHVRRHIKGVLKGSGYDLKNGGLGFIDKVKIQQMKCHKRE